MAVTFCSSGPIGRRVGDFQGPTRQHRGPFARSSGRKPGLDSLTPLDLPAPFSEAPSRRRSTRRRELKRTKLRASPLGATCRATGHACGMSAQCALPGLKDDAKLHGNLGRRPEHVRLSVPASLSHTFRHFSLFNIHLFKVCCTMYNPLLIYYACAL